MAKTPMRVAVTGAAGQIGYSLLFRIANGDMLGKDQPVILQLLEIDNEKAQKALKGVMMEIDDCAFPLLAGMTAHSDPMTAFKDVDVALLVGARPRGPGMERKDLLLENAKIFTAQGAALNKVASRDVKVLVVGNPANTNALIAMSNAPDIPRERFNTDMRLRIDVFDARAEFQRIDLPVLADQHDEGNRVDAVLLGVGGGQQREHRRRLEALAKRTGIEPSELSPDPDRAEEWMRTSEGAMAKDLAEEHMIALKVEKIGDRVCVVLDDAALRQAVHEVRKERAHDTTSLAPPK